MYKRQGIQQVHFPKTFERPFIIAEMIGLAPDRLFPFDAEPGQILEDRVFEFRP